MPGRLIPLITDQTYHIFNRGIDHRSAFTSYQEHDRALKAILYYQYDGLPVRLSTYLLLSTQRQQEILEQARQNDNRLVSFITYCFMPNHFHFQLRQLKEGGISRFMSNFQNSYTRYFNLQHKRTGPLFLDQFVARWIETDEQQLHVHRYIHLNPYSSFIVKTRADLLRYRWSSLPSYLRHDEVNPCEEKAILSSFRDREGYKLFILDQADYQRRLDFIKHLTVDG